MTFIDPHGVTHELFWLTRTALKKRSKRTWHLFCTNENITAPRLSGFFLKKKRTGIVTCITCIRELSLQRENH